MKTLFAAIIAVALGALTATRLTGSEFMDAAEAARRVEAGTAVLIDVREPAEWRATGVAAPAVLLPLSDLRGERLQWKTFLEQNKGKELILYCRSGNRSGIAGGILAKEGLTVANAGAFSHWETAGLPVRQVSAP